MSGKREPVLETVQPHAPQKRDALGNVCLYLHVAVMAFVVVGWLAPWRPLQIFYLAFLPALAIQWRYNADSCVLNNLESYLRTRRWRDPRNVEEGAWLVTLVRDVLGWNVTARQMNAFTYIVLATLWLANLGHMVWVPR